MSRLRVSDPVYFEGIREVLREVAIGDNVEVAAAIAGTTHP